MLNQFRFSAIVAAALIVVSAAPIEVRAIEYYTGEVVGRCQSHDGVAYNVVASVTAPNWYLSMLEYRFIPMPAQSSQHDVDDKTRLYSVPAGNYTVHVGNPGFVVNGSGYQDTYTVQAPDCRPVGKGMTWSLLASNPTYGTIRVGCGNACDPHKGDTPCTTKLPILCIRKGGPGFPLPVPASVDNTNRYNRWSGGVVATTAATLPPAKRAQANALCAETFGEHWRVAEHHDGWGWAFQAYGAVGVPSARFWVDINDAAGTCWK